MNEIESKSPTGWATGLSISRFCQAFIVCLVVAWLIDIPSWFGTAFYTAQLLAVVYGFVLAAIFLGRRISKRARPRVPVYDAVAAIVGLGVMLWVGFTYDHVLIELSMQTPRIVAISAIIILLSLEALRRTSGRVLVVLVLVFVAYAFVGYRIPGALTANYVSAPHLISYLALDVNAMLGAPLRVGTTVVVAYVLFGQLLFICGGGKFFTDIAMAATGRTRGGAAKVAVTASALFGTISGNATSNVASTGIVTIPLMCRGGYTPLVAGAIESVASTGGQLMPPVMGAAAFLMAEFIGVPYSDIVVAAVIPSLLYYWAVFVQVDLIAAKHNIRSADIETGPAYKTLVRGFHFLVPFVVLVFALFKFNLQPESAAIYAIAVLLPLGVLREYDGHRISFGGLVEAVCDSGATAVEMAAILAGAGFVIGVLNVTGGGFALTLFLLGLGGSNLLILLLIAAAACLVLGMGMPTSGVYVLLAALVAPAIVQAGVPKMAAHMFILYFGMLSAITPPIALACFAAAVLSKADPVRTAIKAMGLAWIAYIIPFMFVLSPSLLGQGGLANIIINTATAAFGVYVCSVGLVGHFVRALALWKRVLAGFGGILMILPGSAIPFGNTIVLFGLVLDVLLLVWEFIDYHRALRSEAPTSVGSP